MKMDQCRRQAPAFVGERLVRRGINARDQLETALAPPCQSVTTRRAGPICQGVWHEHPLRLAFKSPRNLRCALGFVAALTLSSLGYSASPLATTDGLIGATSTGSTTISVIIPSRIRVMGFEDITLGTYNGVALTGSSPACVSRNGPGSYSVTMTSANGSFVLRSVTQATTIPYTVAWGANSIPYNRATGAFATDNTSLASCTPVANRLSVTVPPADMDVAQPGAYADTLSVMVAPL